MEEQRKKENREYLEKKKEELKLKEEQRRLEKKVTQRKVLEVLNSKPLFK
jgi:hypothetical protein